MDINDATEWLFNEWDEISKEHQMSILDDMCWMLITDDEDVMERARARRALIKTVEKAREDTP